MPSSARFSRSSTVSHDNEPRFGGIGRILRQVYRRALRPVKMADEPVTPPQAPTPPPSASFEEAVGRVKRATDGLLVLSALTINPADPEQLNAGIDLALRRLSEDVHQ